MNNILKNYQAALQHERKRLEKILSTYERDEIVQKNLKGIQELYDGKDGQKGKIESAQPIIMVYGIYNAGKSSILNELMGEDRAKVADVPMTDRVDPYEWNGYTIWDTPGVSAPKIHENVTQEHLKKADIVLFVMSTTGSNEKAENYSRMKEISDAGKKIIIVLNDKDGDLGVNDEAIRLIKVHVANHMKQVGIQDVDSKYCIVAVNAMRARKGRKENKAGLLQKSNMEELKQVMLSELKQASSFAVLRNATAQIEKFLREIITTLDKAAGAIVSDEINGLLSKLQEEKKNLRQEINNYIYEKTDRLGYNLPLLVWDYRDDQERVNEVVCKEVESLVSKTQKHMEILVKDIIVDDLHNELEILENKLLDIKNAGFREIVIHQERIDALRTEESMDRQKSMLANFHEILKQLEEISKTGKIPNLQELKISDEASGVAGAVASGIGAQMALDSAGTIASNLAKTAIGKAVVKTAAGKAVSSVIGGAVPYIGPLITLAGLLHTFLGGSANDGVAEQRQAEAENEYQRKKLEAEEQMRQDLQQKCRYMAENIADELVLAMDASVNDIVAAYEKPFHEQIEKAKEMDDGRMNDLIALREILGAYEKIEIELGGK